VSETIIGGDAPDEEHDHGDRVTVTSPSVERLLTAAAHVHRPNQQLRGLVPTLSDPSAALADLVEVVRIGERRRRWTELEPGTYATTADDQCIVVKKRVRVQVEEEFRFSYPQTRTDPGWRIVGYDLNSVTPSAPPKALQAPSHPSWWTRLWGWLRGRARLPEARLIGSRGDRA